MWRLYVAVENFFFVLAVYIPSEDYSARRSIWFFVHGWLCSDGKGEDVDSE